MKINKLLIIFTSDGFNLVLSLFMIGILVYSNYLNNEVNYKTNKHDVTYTKDGGKVVHESWNKDKDNNSYLSDFDSKGNKVSKLGNKAYSRVEKEYIKCISRVKGNKLKVITDYKYSKNYYTNKDMSSRSEGILFMIDSCYMVYLNDLESNKLDKKDYVKNYNLITNFNNEVKNIKINISNNHLNNNVKGVYSEVQRFKDLRSNLKYNIKLNKE